VRSAEAENSGAGRAGSADCGGPKTVLALVVIGAALGISEIIHGAYDASVWEPIAVGALALVVALTTGDPRRLLSVILFWLIGLWIWSLISSTWSDSSDNSYLAGDRWLLYAAIIAVLAWAVRDNRSRGLIVLAGASVGVVGIAIWMLAKMLGGHGAELFLGTRLNSPLGYVNGQAGYLLVGVWPCLALAERRGANVTPVLAGVGMAGVVLLLGLGVLTQSRSWGIAVIASTLLLLVGVPGRRRRAAADLVIAGTIAAIYGPLASVWRHPSALTGLPTSASTAHAAVAILMAASGAGAGWAIAVGVVDGLAPAGSSRRAWAVRLATAGLAALALAIVVGLDVNASSIAHRIHLQYEAFVHLAPSPGSTRLLSGGGNRYDYWRVAITEFRSAPVNGVGAGNYQPGYYLHRRTSESIQQPHSLELQTLAELGIVGALLLAAFLAAVAVALWRTARLGRADQLARSVAVAAGGVFIGWLIQTSVDWLHLFPGLTAIALAAAVAVTARPEAKAKAVSRRTHLAAIGIAAVIAIAGSVIIVPRVVSLHSSAQAQRALADGQPRVAIADATTALDYDPSSATALVLRAAGFARLHAFAPSLADLRKALSAEPKNWTLWVLLGDLYLRRGDRPAARAAYAHAFGLNPLDLSLHDAATARLPVPAE